MKQLVIGLGTGRCGTNSLAHLLSLQFDSRCTHEAPPLLTWQFSAPLLHDRLAELASRPVGFAGDVAFYYLPYVEAIAEAHPSAKFVCLKRDKTATVESFLAKTQGVHHWHNHGGQGWELSPDWDPCFPKYDLPDKAAALTRYWEEYYDQAEALAARIPNFRIFPMEVLNDRAGVEDLLRFIGYERASVVVGTRRNRSQGVGKFCYDVLSKATHWLGLNPHRPHAQQHP